MKNNDKLLREFIRRKIISDSLKREKEEFAIRQWVRSQIVELQSQQILETLYESRDMANPHPNTGINKLRDAIRKAKPSIKTKYQQLTTSSEQRESFKNHFLAAFIRLFDQLDALSASETVDDETLDVSDDITPSSEEGELQAPPEAEMDQIEKDLEGLLENVLKELNIDLFEEEEEGQPSLASKQYKKIMSNIENSPELTSAEEIADDIRVAMDQWDNDENTTVRRYKNLGFDERGMRILAIALESETDPAITYGLDKKDVDVVSGDIESEKEKQKSLSQVEKDVERKKAQEREREEFGKGIEGDATGRNQAFDTFNLVQSYFSDNYLDLDSSEDKEMFKKWCLYNLKLLLDSYEQELQPQLEEPNIQNPT